MLFLDPRGRQRGRTGLSGSAGRTVDSGQARSGVARGCGLYDRQVVCGRRGLVRLSKSPPPLGRAVDLGQDSVQGLEDRMDVNTTPAFSKLVC